MDQKILVTRSSMPPIEDYFEEIRELWQSHWLTNMGVKHETLRKQLKDYLRVDNIELFCNGHMALELTLQAMDFEEGSEVITTPFTFASTTHAIVRNFLSPVFCDVEPEFFTIDPDKIESLITQRTRAILPVHVYGNICDIKKIEAIARKYNLRVIYDAAHAFGETITIDNVEHGVGEFGVASMFSFHATKVFNTIEGGAVCFKDENIGARLYKLKNFGIRDAETVDYVGANAKMNEFCAAMGICNLRYVDGEISKRQAVFEKYSARLSDVDGIKFPRRQKNVRSNYSYLPVIFDGKFFDRNEIYSALASKNIFARKYFYPIANEFDCYKHVFKPSKTPTALDLSHRVLTLPMFADLDFKDIDRICDIILSCKK